MYPSAVSRGVVCRNDEHHVYMSSLMAYLNPFGSQLSHTFVDLFPHFFCLTSRFFSVVLGYGAILRQEATRPILEVRHVVLKTSSARLRALKPTYLRAKSGRWGGREATLQLHVHELTQGKCHGRPGS